MTMTDAEFEEQMRYMDWRRSMPTNAVAWLRKHPEFLMDAAMNRKIGGAHNYLVDNKGLQPFSEAYFDALDTEFGFKAELGDETAALLSAALERREEQPDKQLETIPLVERVPDATLN
jgi:hypothetical protein